MITKERLKELIKEKATIYVITHEPFIAGASSFIGIKEEKLSKESNIGKDNTLYWKDMGIAELEYLYETKEDAEEYLKYGNITKTEELVMADWNDVKNTTYGFCGSFDDGTISYTLSIKDGYIYVDMLDYYYLEHTVNCLFRKEFNRENYNEARDLFVKLFKGEKI